MEFSLTTWQWIILMGCGWLYGLSKAGIKGVATVAVPLMAIVFGGKASTGIVLPMLIIADVMAVIYYNRHAQWSYLLLLLPWTMVGVILGVWAGEWMEEAVFRDVMAILILLSVVSLFWWERRPDVSIPGHWWFSALMGIAAGFTTMVGNLAGAIVSIYLLAVRLPKDRFIGTGAWFFFIINLFKVPMHIIFWKTISWKSLALDAMVIPAIGVGFLIGIFLVSKMNEGLYRRLVLVMTALAALVLLIR